MCCGFASLARRATTDAFGHVEAGKMLVMLDRGDYWQCAYVIAKRRDRRGQEQGLDAFRDSVVQMSPFLADRIGELKAGMTSSS